MISWPSLPKGSNSELDQQIRSRRTIQKGRIHEYPILGRRAAIGNDTARFVSYRVVDSARVDDNLSALGGHAPWQFAKLAISHRSLGATRVI